MSYKKFLFTRLFLFLFFNGSLIAEESNKICQISVPKSGTHLLIKVVGLLSKKTPIGMHNNFLLSHPSDAISLQNSEGFLLTHLIYNEVNENILLENNFKAVLILRDPRDMIVSLAFFKLWMNAWHLEDVPVEDRITFLINKVIVIIGISQDFKGRKTVNELYREHYLPWVDKSYVCTTTFEKIVGSLGGGDDNVQHNEIIRISKFLGQEVSLEEAIEISHQLFGDSYTFREGRIGGWKKHFSVSNKEEFKRVAGQLLIDLGYEKDFDW